MRPTAPRRRISDGSIKTPGPAEPSGPDAYSPDSPGYTVRNKPSSFTLPGGIVVETRGKPLR